MNEPANPTAAGSDEPEAANNGLTPELVEDALKALHDGRRSYLRELVTPLHYADAADLLEQLSAEDRRELVEIMRPTFAPEILSELGPTVRDEVVEQLGTADVAAALTELESDDAVEVVHDLDAAEQREVLDALPEDERTVIEEGLTFPDDSAGRLMQREIVTVPPTWTVGDTIDFLRREADADADTLPADFYDVFVIDIEGRPIGQVPLSHILRSRRPVIVSDLMETEMKMIPATMDQEEVAFLFRQRDLISAPVVDAKGQLIGAITIDDVVDVIDEEHEEDIMRFAGVHESDLHESAIKTAWRRQTWLVVTLFNAIIASVVILQFEAAIEKLVALAVLMPIVAAMGGNAGMQVVAVVVRSLATRELIPSNPGRIIGKELLVGAMNGVVFAAILATLAAAWFRDIELGLVLGAAMIFNMLWAGFAGTAIPLALARVGVDPAVAAGPFVTTTTDVFGFFVFLGLASWLIL